MAQNPFHIDVNRINFLLQNKDSKILYAYYKSESGLQHMVVGISKENQVDLREHYMELAKRMIEYDLIKFSRETKRNVHDYMVVNYKNQLSKMTVFRIQMEERYFIDGIFKEHALVYASDFGITIEEFTNLWFTLIAALLTVGEIKDDDHNGFQSGTEVLVNQRVLEGTVGRVFFQISEEDELGGEGMVFLTEEITYPCIKIHREVLITEVYNSIFFLYFV
jgi:hypothetical protein